MTKDGKWGKGVLKRIGMPNKGYNEIRNLLTNMNFSMRLKLMLLKCFITSVLLKECEAWPFNQNLGKILDAAEMRFLRRRLRVPWTARSTNERVMEIA